MVTDPPHRPARNHGWAPLLVILAVLVAVTAVALALTGKDEGSKATACEPIGVTAEVDLRPAVRTDEPAKLAAAADILSRRLAPYGCPKVRVEGDRLHVSTSADGEKHLDEVLAVGELQFREVLEAGPRGASSGCLTAAPGTPPDTEIPACSQDHSEQYRLGPAKVVGTDIEGAAAQHDQQLGQWQVIVHFTDDGQRKWTALTRDTVGKRLAMVLDGVVISAPTIQERIDGDAQISGSFTEDSAKALARTLQLGALPIPLVRA